MRFLGFFLFGFALQLSAAEVDDAGMVVDENLPIVKAHCTPCHSAKLITQNRMSRDGWRETIVWMQEKHNLWDLGDNETAIIAYLDKHYGVPQRPHRRQPLNQPPLEMDSR